MAFGVSRRLGFNEFIDGFLAISLVAFVERSCADDFLAARGSGEVATRFASAFPGGRDGGEAVIREAPELRPDPGVEDSDDDVIGVVGVGP